MNAPLFGFTRFTTFGLWDRYGAQCDLLGGLRFFNLALLNGRQPLPPGTIGGGDVARVPLPGDVPTRGPHGTVEDLGIQRTTSAAMAARSGAVREAVARADGNGSGRDLTREATAEMVQRQQIATLMADWRCAASSG